MLPVPKWKSIAAKQKTRAMVARVFFYFDYSWNA